MNGPLDFRVREEPDKDEYDYIPIRWQKHIQRTYKIVDNDETNGSQLLALTPFSLLLAIISAFFGFWMLRYVSTATKQS